MFEFNLIRFLVEIRELKIQSVEWKTHTTLTETKKLNQIIINLSCFTLNFCYWLDVVVEYH